MDRKLLFWEIGGFIFIGLVGASLHFTYELSNFSDPVVAFFSAVNESTWEHLKMVFWPGLVFMAVEYTYVKDQARNYLVAKTAGLFIMPLVIVLGWYAYTPFTGRSFYPLDLALFYLAVFLGQFASYQLMTRPLFPARFGQVALTGLLVMLVCFSTFTYFPPRIFLFEHFDLKDTGEYGILQNYDNLRYFTKPPTLTP